MAAGRVFQDRPAFVSKPERVVFTDFTVGKVHRRRVVLTNVSLTFNTFKVLEMPDEITRFFRVTYSKPGRLSAGMTCAVDIVFIPKVDEDIFTELPIRTQTGRLSIPVVCTARRVKPSLSTNLVVFQGTVTGEKETARVVVTNTGAIPTRFTIQDISPAVPGSPPSSPPLLPSAKLQQTPEPTPAQQIPNDGNDNSIAAAFNGDLQPEELPEDHMKEGKDGDPSSGVALRDALPKTEGQLLARTAAIRNAALRHKEGRAEIEVHAGEGGSGGEGGMAGQAGGKVGAYESSEIVVTFAPLNVGEFRVVKIIKFEGSLDEFRLVVEASSAPVAVFPEEPSTDLRCCVVGKLYIKKIRIRNRGKIAMKVVARVPSCLRHCATFSPDMGFVQPDSNFEFGLRFRPDDDCLARCVRDGWGVQLPQQRDHLKAIRSTEADRCIPRDNEGTQEVGRGSYWWRAMLPNLVALNHRKNGRVGLKADAAGGHGAGGIIAVPVRVDIPGQAFPARLTLLSRISGWKVEVECGSALGDGSIENGHSDDARAKRGDSEGEEVKFGPCFVGQSVVKRVSLRNTSQLPLKFGFMSNPAEVMIQPADGFGALLPGEQRWIQAVFSPTSAVAHNSTLTFRTSMGQTTSMRCRGCGIDPVVSISHTVLNMAPACPGDTVTTSVFVRNVSTVEQ
ncbi:unnamed protein product, partial [Sphacelaria rigidula]